MCEKIKTMVTPQEFAMGIVNDSDRDADCLKSIFNLCQFVTIDQVFALKYRKKNNNVNCDKNSVIRTCGKYI